VSLPVVGFRAVFKSRDRGERANGNIPTWRLRKPCGPSSVRKSQWQPLQSGFPLRCFRCEPDEQQFVDCRPNIEALRDEGYTGALLSSATERTEVSRHR